MERTFAHPLLVGPSHELPRGPRVRLRLAYPRDVAAVRALAGRQGRRLGDLDLARLIRFDPRREATIVATGLVDGSDRLLGVGRITAGAAEPEFVLVDEHVTQGLDVLLRDALLRRAASLARAAA